jgi:inosine-uridine nucleoside N-ribohydrolase
MARPLIMDVDTGIDDAMALALAASLSDYDLVAVTTVAGNVPVERTAENTLRVLSWIGSDAPVYRGMSQPLARTLHTAPNVHGNDGLGAWQEPHARRDVEEVSAPEAIIQTARRHQREIDGVFVGPLTNLAVALTLEPRLAGWFRTVTIMGGAFYSPGNVTPVGEFNKNSSDVTSSVAEFNMYVDPEAAAVVARAALPATWIGLDVTHQVSITHDMWRCIENVTAPEPALIREVCRQTFETRRMDKVHLHDPLAVAVAAYPDLVTVRHGQVRIDVGNVMRGETRLIEGDGRTKVAESVDSGRFMDIFRTALGV